MDYIRFISSIVLSTQETEEEADLDEFSPLGRKIYIAAIQDDWDSVGHIYQQDKRKLNVKISDARWTALQIAVGTNSSHRFVENIVEQIVTEFGVQGLHILNGNDKENALHVAARLGNARAAKLLVSKDPDMPQILNQHGHSPLLIAACGCDVDTLHFLLSATRDESRWSNSNINHFSGRRGADLLSNCIISGHYDVALYLLKRYPHLAYEEDSNRETALESLAVKANAFPSGISLKFWQRIIYSRIFIDDESLEYVHPTVEASTTNILQRYFVKASYVKNLCDMKLRHKQAEKLVTQICSVVLNVLDSKTFAVLGPAIRTAAIYGCHELIEECIRRHPGMLWYDYDGYSFFGLAIKHRQEKVFNIIYQMSAHKINILRPDESGNALHLAGMLAPYHRLRCVTGAALQMQRELQWFKEVAKFAEATAIEFKNDKNMTPLELFNEEHKQLLIDAQEWTTKTSSSSTVVAALIVTMTFTAMFTVPGGNNDQGNPLFLQKGTFLLFVISDAIALFSSATSVLMFLSTLTRSSQEDFLYALPLRLALGFVSLFISLAATMVAFSATLVLVLHNEIRWIAVPITLLSSIPSILFLWLQYPLLRELIGATFGKSIFHKQNNMLLH